MRNILRALLSTSVILLVSSTGIIHSYAKPIKGATLPKTANKRQAPFSKNRNREDLLKDIIDPENRKTGFFDLEEHKNFRLETLKEVEAERLAVADKKAIAEQNRKTREQKAENKKKAEAVKQEEQKQKIKQEEEKLVKQLAGQEIDEDDGDELFPGLKDASPNVAELTELYETNRNFTDVVKIQEQAAEQAKGGAVPNFEDEVTSAQDPAASKRLLLQASLYIASHPDKEQEIIKNLEKSALGKELAETLAVNRIIAENDKKEVEQKAIEKSILVALDKAFHESAKSPDKKEEIKENLKNNFGEDAANRFQAGLDRQQQAAEKTVSVKPLVLNQQSLFSKAFESELKKIGLKSIKSSKDYAMTEARYKLAQQTLQKINDGKGVAGVSADEQKKLQEIIETLLSNYNQEMADANATKIDTTLFEDRTVLPSKEEALTNFKDAKQLLAMIKVLDYENNIQGESLTDQEYEQKITEARALKEEQIKALEELIAASQETLSQVLLESGDKEMLLAIDEMDENDTKEAPKDLKVKSMDIATKPYMLGDSDVIGGESPKITKEIKIVDNFIAKDDHILSTILNNIIEDADSRSFTYVSDNLDDTIPHNLKTEITNALAAKAALTNSERLVYFPKESIWQIVDFASLEDAQLMAEEMGIEGIEAISFDSEQKRWEIKITDAKNLDQEALDEYKELFQYFLNIRISNNGDEEIIIADVHDVHDITQDNIEKIDYSLEDSSETSVEYFTNHQDQFTNHQEKFLRSVDAQNEALRKKLNNNINSLRNYIANKSADKKYSIVVDSHLKYINYDKINTDSKADIKQQIKLTEEAKQLASDLNEHMYGKEGSLKGGFSAVMNELKSKSAAKKKKPLLSKEKVKYHEVTEESLLEKNTNNQIIEIKENINKDLAIQNIDNIENKELTEPKILQLDSGNDELPSENNIEFKNNIQKEIFSYSAISHLGFDDSLLTTQNRMNEINSNFWFNRGDIGVAAGDDGNSLNLGVWTRGVVAKNTQKKTKNLNAFKNNIKGFTIGADAEVLDNSIIGISYGNLNSNVKYKELSTKYNIKTDAFSIYSQSIFGNVLWQNTASAAVNKIKHYYYDLQNSSSKSYNYNLSSNLSYDKQIQRNIALVPNVGLKLKHFNEGKVNKKYNQNHVQIGARKSTQLSVNTGVSIVASYKLENGLTFIPELSGGVEHIFYKNNNKINAEFFTGNKYYTQNIDLPKSSYKNTANIGTGLSVKHNNLEVSLNTNFTFATGYLGRQGSIKFKLSF